MKIRNATFATLAAALGAAIAVSVSVSGCGDDNTCPAESPQVSALSTNCSAVANTTVSFPVRLCPSCNQTLAGCDVDMSGATATGGLIFLNPTVEACEPPSSCSGGPTCLANPTACTFTAPNAPVGTEYFVDVYDPAIHDTRRGSLTIVANAPSCAL
jgi:hypothetical protein